jgi:uncharacterized phage protein (predicted DNA packaging)
MPELTTDDLKTYLRVDGSEDDTILALHLDAAKDYLAKSGVVDSDSPLYKQAILIHVLLNYQNYDSSLNVNALNKSLTSIVLQLRG